MDTGFCQLLDVVSWGRVVGDIECACESVEAIAYCDVEGFAEDAVALRGVGYYLGVAAGDVEATDGLSSKL